jgi:hypothetical protein
MLKALSNVVPEHLLDRRLGATARLPDDAAVAPPAGEEPQPLLSILTRSAVERATQPTSS